VLADFIQATMVGHNLSKPPIAIGFSNGAFMTTALLLTRPRLLASAILFDLFHRSGIIQPFVG
jgi:phospholipase/carboxylesterase